MHKARWIIGTNVLDPAVLSDQQLVTTYKEQGGVERGFRFLKDPLFLDSSVFVKKPERIMALSFIMVLCLLVYRLTEFRLRSRLAQTQQTIPLEGHAAIGMMPTCCNNPNTSMFTQPSTMRLFSNRKITMPMILPVLPVAGMPMKGPF